MQEGTRLADCPGASPQEASAIEISGPAPPQGAAPGRIHARAVGPSKPRRFACRNPGGSALSKVTFDTCKTFCVSYFTSSPKRFAKDVDDDASRDTRGGQS